MKRLSTFLQTEKSVTEAELWTIASSAPGFLWIARGHNRYTFTLSDLWHFIIYFCLQVFKFIKQALWSLSIKNDCSFNTFLNDLMAITYHYNFQYCMELFPKNPLQCLDNLPLHSKVQDCYILWFWFDFHLHKKEYSRKIHSNRSSPHLLDLRENIKNFVCVVQNS